MMRLRRQAFPILVTVMGALCSVAGDTSLSDFEIVRPVLWHGAQEELIGVALDGAAWSALNDRIGDLRVVDTQGAFVPYVRERVMISETSRVERLVESLITGMDPVGPDEISLDVALGKKAPSVSVLDIQTHLKDFERRISIEGTDKEGRTRVLVEEALIYDYSRYADVRHTRVALPPNAARRFTIRLRSMDERQESPRVQITRTFEGDREVKRTDQRVVTARTFRVESVRCLAHSSRETRRVPLLMGHPVSVTAGTDEKQDEQSTHVLLEVPRAPITEWVFDVAERNFGRAVRVEVPSVALGAEGWRVLARGKLSRVTFRSFKKESLSIRVPEMRSDRYRLVIDNGDSPPLTVEGATARGPTTRVLLLAGEGGAYRLVYGAPGVKAPRYDTDALHRIRRHGVQPVTVVLGEETVNPAYVQPGRTAASWLGSRAALVLGVIAAVAVLGVGLVQAVRKVE